MPTHRRLPEIKTSWVCRVEQEGIETGGSGRLWGCRVRARGRLIRKRRERKRDLPLSLFCSELNSTHLSRFNPLQLVHNQRNTCKKQPELQPPTLLYLNLFQVNDYKGNSVHLNDSAGHPPDFASLNLRLWCICHTGANQ